MTDKIAELKARNTAANALADSIDTSRTTTVTAADLKPGDILLTLGNVTFPHPVILAKANVITVGQRTVVALVGTNGWFSGRPANGDDTAVRVLRISEGG
jgi:hypothetical protein